MKNILYATAAAISMAAAPAMAQVQADAPLGSTNSVADKKVEMTAEQQADYEALTVRNRAQFDAWGPDQQVLYYGWDAALRDYYWQLDPIQQDVWWELTPVERISLFQRDISWASVMNDPTPYTVAYIYRLPNYAQSTNDYAQNTRDTEINFVSNARVQAVPPPAGTYPVCKSDADDYCINAWAAGERGPGVDRPLGYYPEDEEMRGG